MNRWKGFAIHAVGADPNPSPDFDGKLPMCRERCPHHDGKRCRLTGFSPGAICEPVSEAISDMAKTLFPDDLLTGAKREAETER